MMKNIEARPRSYHTEMLDLWRPVGATWGPGQNSINSLLMVSPKALEMVVQVFEKARRQGKVRYLGISAHNPKVFRRVLEGYPQFSVIIFPYRRRMSNFHRQDLELVAGDATAHEVVVGAAQVKLLFAYLDCYFPVSRRADPDVVGRIVDDVLRRPAQLRVIQHEPEKRVCIEKKAHYMYSSKSFKCSSSSEMIVIRSLQSPGLRGFRLAVCSPTSLATGR